MADNELGHLTALVSSQIAASARQRKHIALVAKLQNVCVHAGIEQS